MKGQKIAAARSERQWRRGVELLERLFDRQYYESQADERFRTESEAWEHYRLVGAKARVSPHPLFDAGYYQRIYPDLEGLPDVFEHFVLTGDGEGRIPHALFNRTFYLEQHRASGCQVEPLQPWRHYLECPAADLPPCAMWQPVVVEGAEPAAGRDRFLRYLAGDARDLLTPHPAFDAEHLALHVGYRRVPLVYYASRLGDERRAVPCNPLFDQSWYLDHQMPDEPWTCPPLEHYLSRPVARRPQCHPYLLPETLSRCLDGDFDLAEVMRMTRWSTLAPPSREAADLDALLIDIDSVAITIVSCLLLLLSARAAGLQVRPVLVDNASTWAPESEVLQRYLPFALVSRFTQRRSFGEANNLLAEQGAASHILLLNNDAFLGRSDLATLHQVQQGHPHSVAVGPTFVYPDGTCQESGGVVVPDGTPIQLAKHMQRLPARLLPDREVDYVSAAVLLVRRDAFEQVAGFSFVYEPAYFEDTDLCRRLGTLGPVVVTTRAQVVHYEGHTTGREGVLPEKVLSQALARTKFSASVGQPVELPPLPEAAAIVSGRPRALVYSPYGLMMGGGERYLLSMARSLAVDHDVALAFDGPYSQSRLRQVQHALGLPVQAYPLHDVALGWRTVPTCDVFVAMANSLVPPLAPHGRVNVYMCQFPFPSGEARTFGARARLQSWDVVVVNSGFTRDAYLATAKQLGHEPRVTVIPPPCQLFDSATRAGEALSPELRIVNVGRFFHEGHSKRQDVAVEALRLLVADEVPAGLVLVGGVASDAGARDYFLRVSTAARELPVQIEPDASRSLLARRLAEAQFYWHTTGVDVPASQPERMEHFGIAVVEAMSAGCIPIVSPTGGPREIVERLGHELFARTPQEFAELTARIWQDEELARTLRGRAVEEARQYGEALFEQRFARLVRDVLGTQVR